MERFRPTSLSSMGQHAGGDKAAVEMAGEHIQVTEQKRVLQRTNVPVPRSITLASRTHTCGWRCVGCLGLDARILVTPINTSGSFLQELNADVKLEAPNPTWTQQETSQLDDEVATINKGRGT
eukprot:2232845-Pyramimonas_sp.AAC.1